MNQKGSRLIRPLNIFTACLFLLVPIAGCVAWTTFNSVDRAQIDFARKVAPDLKTTDFVPLNPAIFRLGGRFGGSAVGEFRSAVGATVNRTEDSHVIIACTRHQEKDATRAWVLLSFADQDPIATSLDELPVGRDIVALCDPAFPA